MRPLVVLDVRMNVEDNADYEVSVEDIKCVGAGARADSPRLGRDGLHRMG